jgi:glycosyltransferase involved in cell wall biosynthesis
VVPCFRCKDSIRQTVASVAGQSLLPAEVILVEDCSGDGTLGVLHEVAALYPAGWVRVHAMPRNGGPSRARNAGWGLAGQPYVAFLDADDSWHPEKLRLQMQALLAEPDIALSGHPMNVQDRAAPPPPLRGRAVSRPVRRHTLLLKNPFPTASVILKRDLPFRFDEERWRVEDFLLWAQIVLSGHRSVKVNQVLASWHKAPFGAGGLSGDIEAMYRAGVEVRAQLHRSGLLSGPEYRVAQAVGALKQARRRALVRLRGGRQARDGRTAS